jgi:hypothetical protein
LRLHVWYEEQRLKHQPGPKSTEGADLVLGIECLREKNGNEEQARWLFHKSLVPIVEYRTASKRFTRVLGILRAAGVRMSSLLKPVAGKGQP